MKTSGNNYGKKKHFVLIHGASHGAWCWYKVATLLRSEGHNVATLDLAASGLNPKQVNQIRSISDYYEPLMALMESIPATEKVILVGHSLGGVSTSVAMEKFPHKISVAVFATASVLSQNLSYPAILSELSRRKSRNTSGMDTQYTQFFFGDGPTKPPTARLVGPKFMATNMYQLSPPEDLTLALTLVRPVPIYNDVALLEKETAVTSSDVTLALTLLRPGPIYNDVALLEKETAVTSSRNGRVPKIFIISKDDVLLTEDFQNWMIQRSLPFDDIRVIEGSDHMVMFSQPTKLASHLLQIADMY